MIYGAGKYNGQGLGSTFKGNSSQSKCISKTPSDLYSHFVSSNGTENSKMSDAQASVELLKNSAPIALVSKPKKGVQKIFKPKNIQGMKSKSTNLKAGILTPSESTSKVKDKPKTVFRGSPHYGSSGSYKKQKMNRRTNSG
jgi:hypothetical protein